MNRYLTAHIPGTGGVIKESPEDFLVEEVPAYQPCGSGEHLYLLVEKRGITTLEAIRRLARKLNIQERDIGYAGMKDSVGVTRQTMSLQRIKPDAVEGLELDGMKVLSAIPHTNKLKLGHLKGNHFRIVIRDVSKCAADSVPAILKLLEERGVPNYFGHQRYGAQGNSHLIGAAMLRGDFEGAVRTLIGEPKAVEDPGWRQAIIAFHEGNLVRSHELMPTFCRSEREVIRKLMHSPGDFERAFGAVHPRLRDLYLSAFQSSLFDQVLEQRLDSLDHLWDGDVAMKHVNGASFLVETAAMEQPRCDAFEISPTGPLFGRKMLQPAGQVLEQEEKVLQENGVARELFAGTGIRLEGDRRALRVPLSGPQHSLEGTNLVLEFTLPKGSYATTVVREITKSF
jgi:tRNA pseudouridine13 synthase